jgi:hypothetical protein
VLEVPPLDVVVVVVAPVVGPVVDKVVVVGPEVVRVLVETLVGLLGLGLVREELLSQLMLAEL